MTKRIKIWVSLALTSIIALGAAGCAETSEPDSNLADVKAEDTSFVSEKFDISDNENSDNQLTDIYSDEMIAKIKAEMKKEAAATDGKISLIVWCAGDNVTFEKELLSEFKTLYADDDYELNFAMRGSYSEFDAADWIIGNVNNEEDQNNSNKKYADVFNFTCSDISWLSKSKIIAPVSDYFADNVKNENTAESVGEVTVDDVMYAFPKSYNNTAFLYYDKRIFPNKSDVENLNEMIQTVSQQGRHIYFNLENGW